MTLRYLAALLLGAISITGCGTKAPALPEEDSKPSASQVAATTHADPEPPTKPDTPAVPRDRLHQSFADATRPDDNPPADSHRPPDCLKTGTPVFKVLDAVMTSWDSIKFVSPDGKKLRYSAEILTADGPIRLQLLHEQAPNHVRNFIALARAGYYDGLCFERLRREITDVGNFETIEGGCPEGNGDLGMGHIGYWLKDELTPAATMSHDEGVVVACRGTESDASACRFYISLTKAPFLDGGCTIFAKVTGGLDIARKIFQKPIASEDKAREEGARRPETPIMIQRVTITQESE